MADEIKTKIDLSNISKPGDVLKAHQQTTGDLPRQQRLRQRVCSAAGEACE